MGGPLKKEVAENILPFWARHAVDRENGGFYVRSIAICTSTCKRPGQP